MMEAMMMDGRPEPWMEAIMMEAMDDGRKPWMEAMITMKRNTSHGSHHDGSHDDGCHEPWMKAIMMEDIMKETHPITLTCMPPSPARPASANPAAVLCWPVLLQPGDGHASAPSHLVPASWPRSMMGRSCSSKHRRPRGAKMGWILGLPSGLGVGGLAAMAATTLLSRSSNLRVHATSGRMWSSLCGPWPSSHLRSVQPIMSKRVFWSISA